MRVWLAIPLALFGFCAYAQPRCATDNLPQNLNRPESISELQHWISKQVEKSKLTQKIPGEGERKAILTVPVVFHIIHNGEPIGSGTNLSDERIQQQLVTLNEDFRRQNADASQTQAQFLPVAADSEINFVLAQRDPEGLPSTGITRTQGPLTTYPDDAALLTAVIQWPPEDVINIYIAPLSSSLGFAKFPYSTISGMDSRFNGYREIDGLFVDYEYTGNNDASSLEFESKGRTVTHEMGHYLGLIHIFQGCGLGDYCEDTPSQSGSTSGCPSSKSSCDSPDMFQNYLDYTNDVCMNLFTECQKQRMQAVLNASPRRVSLLNSPMLVPAIEAANDLGIKRVESPKRSDCSNQLTPLIELRNYGTNSITSFKVRVFANDELKETKTASATLNLLDTYSLSFSEITVDESRPNTLRFEIFEVNGVSDGNDENNETSILLPKSDSQILPYLLNFETPVLVQAETELGRETSWSFSTAPNSEALNQAIYLPNHNSISNYGIKDYFFTDLLDVSTITSLQLTFSYAYSGIPNGSLDGLIVAVSKDCGQTFNYSDFAFERYGSALQTTSPTTESFVPGGPDDWEETSINLTQFLTGSSLQVAFIGINGSGNNLYIDNIQLTSGDLRSLDIGIRDVSNISPVTCRTKVFPSISIKNYGYTPISSFNLSVKKNGLDTLISYTNQHIVSGASKTFSNTALDLTEGANDITFTLKDLNNSGDEFTSNDTFNITVFVDTSTEELPLKESFEVRKWLVNETGNVSIFDIVSVQSNQVLRGLAYDSGSVGSQTYIVSPTFQTGSNREGAVRFRYSYAARPGYNDNLKIFVSNDCGNNYSFKVLDFDSDELSQVQSLDPWRPGSADDWRTGFVDISEYMIWGSLRVAFVFTNGNGNNIYLDNLEVILNNDPTVPVFDLRFEVYPIPAVGRFNVAMNLPVKETIRIRLIDMSGKAVLDDYFPNTLNQTYEFIAPSQRGYYILQVIGDQVYQYRRIFIDQ